MEDIISEIVDFLRLDNGASAVQELLGENPETRITADFDPDLEARPYIIVLLPHNPNKYNALGNTTRVENPIVTFLAFTDTRAECVSLLDALEGVLIRNADFGNGPPTVTDKITQMELGRIDAYKGTLNLQYFVGQTQ